MSLKLDHFNPSLSKNNNGTWTAKTSVAAIGDVAVTSQCWESAKLGLWLVTEALEALSAKPVKPFNEWTPSEWRSAITTMRKVMRKNHSDS